MLSIDSLGFDTTGLELVKQSDREKFWVRMEGGEIVVLAFFRPHDFAWDAASPELRERYEKISQSVGGTLIDCQVRMIAGLECIRVVSKMWAEREGPANAYSASLSVVLEDCCYILNVTDQERGITGLREAADEARYDEAFAEHPLSRVRAILDDLETSLRPAPELAQAKPFRLPRK